MFKNQEEIEIPKHLNRIECGVFPINQSVDQPKDEPKESDSFISKAVNYLLFDDNKINRSSRICIAHGEVKEGDYFVIETLSGFVIHKCYGIRLAEERGGAWNMYFTVKGKYEWRKVPSDKVIKILATNDVNLILDGVPNISQSFVNHHKMHGTKKVDVGVDYNNDPVLVKNEIVIENISPNKTNFTREEVVHLLEVAYANTRFHPNEFQLDEWIKTTI